MSAYCYFVAFFYGIALKGIIYTFYLGCMVNEITGFYRKPDMTSSIFRRQGRFTQFVMTDSERVTMTFW